MERGKKHTSYTIKKREKKQNELFDDEFCGKSLERISTTVSSHSDLYQPCFSQYLNGSIEPLYGSEQEPMFLDSLSLENIFAMAKTKAGSKRLQQFIAKSRPEEIEKIVAAVAPHMGDLMVDLYGNYMCQTLFHNCSAGQRLSLLSAMRSNLLTISFHPRGTHALQNLIAMTSLKEEETIYREEFQGKLIEMSKDNNASHVVQRLLVTVSNRYFIIREILGKVEELSRDKLGVCVIKKCCNDPEIMNEIIGSCLILIQHPYGNYAVQSVLEI